MLASALQKNSCCHLHKSSFDRAVARAQYEMTKPGIVGDSKAVGTVLRSPGGAEGGELPKSSLFRFLNYHDLSFFNSAGVLLNPVLPSHLVAKSVNGLHIATIVPGGVRGNHMHLHSTEVLVLVHGRFLLRVASLGNDGVWTSEDHLFEVGVAASPFSTHQSTVSTMPLGIEIPTDTCHALKNIDSPAEEGGTGTTAFFASYFVRPMDEKREEPDRDTCRNQKSALLA